jgi:Flp pilus assembly protein TadD
MRRRPGLVVFCVAFAIRVLYVLEIRDLPWFGVPLVDGANYFNLAATIAAGDLAGGPDVYWQPPLYPYLIALLLSIFGPNMLAIYLVQAVIGATTCLLIVRIGRRIFDNRAGFAAGLIAAFYGPLIHFDAQPLIPVLHVVLVTAGLLAILRGAGIPGPSPAPGRDWALGGAAWGLAAIATPNILFAAPVVVAWAWWPGRRSSVAPGADPPDRWRRGWAAFAVALALPVALVAARNLAVAGEAVLISSNGGINFFIGNNPDYERTVRIRPGGEFERLAQEPENLGIGGAAAKSRWFARRGLAFLHEYPGPAARLYVRKAFDLIAGREIGRNEDAYSYRQTSWILSALLWRWIVSFPFGVVAPLALAGMVASRAGAGQGGAAWSGASRDGSALLLGCVGAYAISILLFFPTDRYRLPIVPFLALFAGAAIAPFAEGRHPRARLAAVFLAGLVIFNLDALHPTEAWPVEAVLNRAYARRMQGRQAEAIEEYRRAARLDPRRIDPHNALGALAVQQGRWEEAARHYETLVGLAPDFVEARRSLAQSLMALGRVSDARAQLEIAVGLAPRAGLALADLCLTYVQEGQAAQGEIWCRRAVEARPDLAETHMALGLMARSLRQRDLARREFETAARLFPRGSRGRDRVEEILGKMRRRDTGAPIEDVASPP